MRTLIVADGGKEQLAEWAGGYRHLIELEGEILLHRTVAQFARHGEVAVLGDYRVDDAQVFQPLSSGLGGVDMLAKTVPYLHPQDKTVIVFGDVWFSHDAVETIVGHVGGWRVFGRPHPSKLTGTPWGEYFAMMLYPEDRDLFVESIGQAWEDSQRGVRASPWEVYYKMDGLPIQTGATVDVGAHWTTIDDWTDDFDFITDVERWQQRRKESHYGRDARVMS